MGNSAGFWPINNSVSSRPQRMEETSHWESQTAILSSKAVEAEAAANKDNEMSTWILGIALACALWYFFTLVVQAIGLIQLWVKHQEDLGQTIILSIRRYRYYSSKPKPPVSPTLKLDDVPHVTILRPVKGLEPQLYECLAATFRQEYPLEKLTIYFCVASADDPAYPVLQRLLSDFPKFDAKLFIEEKDDGAIKLGPNPKIRNMSRAYREAKGDIIWIIDCNVWVGKGVAGRMVDKLCGFKAGGKRCVPYKFVHQLPLVVDGVGVSIGEEARGLLRAEHDIDRQLCSTQSFANDMSSAPKDGSTTSIVIQTGGGRLEEMFMATSHAKFYTAINTVSVAPCIVGKSNMFRRSHLDFLTSSASKYSPGIDFFSENICEDHLIGDLFWRKKVPGQAKGEKWYNHGLVFGDVAIQPMARMSVNDYIGRRIRWLRVRKWTVPLATLVEPGVEPLLCSAYGAFAITTIPWFHNSFRVPQTWLAFILIWLASVALWMIADSLVYAKLHSGSSIEVDEDTPSFALPPRGQSRRPLGEWIAAWFGREVLALPVWSWACLGGTTVMWRGKKFRVNLDMRVVEIKDRRKIEAPEVERPRR